MLCTVHTTQGQGQVQEAIVFYYTHPGRCPCDDPVQCARAIRSFKQFSTFHSSKVNKHSEQYMLKHIVNTAYQNIISPSPHVRNLAESSLWSSTFQLLEIIGFATCGFLFLIAIANRTIAFDVGSSVFFCADNTSAIRV